MIIYGVYVVSESGVTLVSEKFQAPANIHEDVLLGGLITALQHMAVDIHQSEMKTMEIEGLSYHIRSFGLYRIVLVTDVPQTPENLIQILGLRFMKEHGERLLEQGERGKIFQSTIFEPFKQTIHEIFQTRIAPGDLKSNPPTKKLNTGEIFSLPHQLHATALAVVTLKEGTIEEIAQESNSTLEDTSIHLSRLRKMGYIGTKLENGSLRYFCAF